MPKWHLFLFQHRINMMIFLYLRIWYLLIFNFFHSLVFSLKVEVTLCRLNPTFERPKVGKSLYSPYTTSCRDGECVASLPHSQIKYLEFDRGTAVAEMASFFILPLI